MRRRAEIGELLGTGFPYRVVYSRQLDSSLKPFLHLDFLVFSSGKSGKCLILYFGRIPLWRFEWLARARRYDRSLTISLCKKSRLGNYGTFDALLMVYLVLEVLPPVENAA